MCGIAGYLSFTGRPVSSPLLERMTGALAHRGPDGEGFHLDGPLGLGHRRLAIIDLTAAAAQPMAAADGRLWLTYNGEIFNFHEVRAELVTRGHAFTTCSDSEVILAAYLEWGPACLDRLNGMFAFALWDGRSRELWLVRDRLGVKPLFYTLQPGFLAFASEIKGVLPALPAPPALDHEALHHFLSLNWTPAPRTLFRDVRQLPPAHHLVVGADGAHRLTRWWDVRPAPVPADVDDALAALLQDSVRLRLVSDVEVGAFLSSGVDSAAVVAWMSRQTHGPVKTFTAGFGEASYDESAAAAGVARALEAEHVVEPVASTVLDALPDIVWHSEELTADSSMLAVYGLARRARADVKVVLTGDGADEVFGGYPTYLATRLASAYRHVPRVVRERVIRPLVARLPVSDRKASLESQLRRFVDADVSDTARAHASWRAVWREADKPRLLRDADGHPATSTLYEPFLARAPGGDAVNRLLYADLCFYLPNDMLVKVDRMTMAWGLEARTPYLDYRVVELAAGLSSWRKCVGGLRPKFLLRRVASRALPPRARPRPKAGFNLPVARWLRTDRRDVLERHLLDVRPGVLEVITRAEIERLVREHVSGVADHAYKLWGLLCLSLWWRRFLEARG
jgi:asparagine synthase (glutamine-hydrolysing)